MKKIICTALLTLAMVASLVSCGKFTCDGCDEEKKGKKHEIEVLGEEVVLCDDCYEELEELGLVD